jgi:hypothetical protein
VVALITNRRQVERRQPLRQPCWLGLPWRRARLQSAGGRCAGLARIVAASDPERDSGTDDEQHGGGRADARGRLASSYGFLLGTDGGGATARLLAATAHVLRSLRLPARPAVPAVILARRSLPVLPSLV